MFTKWDTKIADFVSQNDKNEIVVKMGHDSAPKHVPKREQRCGGRSTAHTKTATNHKDRDGLFICFIVFRFLHS